MNPGADKADSRVLAKLSGGEPTDVGLGLGLVEHPLIRRIVVELQLAEPHRLRIGLDFGNVAWIPNNDYDRPESGKEYVLVATTITNTGKSSVPYNTFDFKLQDSNGVQKNEAFTTAENKLNSGDLAANGKVSGNLVFEALQGDTGLKLIFNPTLLGREAIIKL